jgi:hypothetical protein
VREASAAAGRNLRAVAAGASDIAEGSQSLADEASALHEAIRRLSAAVDTLQTLPARARALADAAV